MSCFRDRCAANVGPMFLRLMLGAIFLYAGLGKVSQMKEVSGEQAAILANMGILTPTGAAATPPATPDPTAPPKLPEPKKTSIDPAEPRIVTVQQAAARVYTAADFPTPVRVRTVNLLALGIHAAANPPEGKMPLWPPSIGKGNWPKYLAWAVALTELLGGLGLLLGFLTRVWALGIAGVMAGAMWLTEMGPAIQKGTATLGFLPDYPVFGEGWQHFMFQFALFMSAMALVFIGPGRMSLDSALLPGRGPDHDDAD